MVQFVLCRALQRGGLEKNPLGFSHISMGSTSPADFSQIGDIACAALCRFLQADALKTRQGESIGANIVTLSPK